MSRPAQTTEISKAFFNILASSICFAVMTTFVKKLSQDLHPFEVVFFRTLINFVLVLGVLHFYRHNLKSFLGAQKRKVLIIRGVFGFMAVTALFLSIQRLPVGVASRLNWSSPLFVILLSRIFIGERPNRLAWLFIVVAFGGLLLLVDPFKAIHGGVGLSSVGILMGVVGAACAGAAMVAIRAATLTVGAEVIVAWYTGIASLLSFPLMISVFKCPSSSQWPLILAMGVTGSAAQLFMTQCYRFAPAGIVSVMGLMTAAVSSIFGYVFFGDTLDLTQWIGVAILALGVAGTAWVR